MISPNHDAERALQQKAHLALRGAHPHMSQQTSTATQGSSQRQQKAVRPQSIQKQAQSSVEEEHGGSDSESVPEAQQHAEFYDSESDDKDQAWMQQQRQGRSSDAILSCPGCLTTVCIECQRHEFIPAQYRAMFVRNCR